MNETLNDKWSDRSFYHDPIVLKDGQVQGTPELVTPWSPPGVLEVATAETGEVTGTLTFPVAVLKVSGKIIPANDKCPASAELTGEGFSSLYNIKGFFIPGSDHVVGTAVCVANDLLKRPNGTLGPFVLVPIKA